MIVREMLSERQDFHQKINNNHVNTKISVMSAYEQLTLLSFESFVDFLSFFFLLFESSVLLSLSDFLVDFFFDLLLSLFLVDFCFRLGLAISAAVGPFLALH